MVHYKIQWTCNQVVKITSYILYIKKLMAVTNFTNGCVHDGPNGNFLELRDQIKNNK